MIAARKIPVVRTGVEGHGIKLHPTMVLEALTQQAVNQPTTSAEGEAV